MDLTSSAFEDNQRIPRRYTGEGDDISPPLAWTGFPAGTQSLALICEDPDAPKGTFHHWAAYDIAPTLTTLPAGVPSQPDNNRIRQAINDFGRHGYGGPMPPRGHGPHRYRFRLIALDTAHLPLPPDASVLDVENAAMAHKIAEANLVGLYER